MATDRDHRWADRMVAMMQALILLSALAFALATWWFGDSSTNEATGPIPAMPWRSHPPLEVYR